MERQKRSAPRRKSQCATPGTRELSPESSYSAGDSDDESTSTASLHQHNLETQQPLPLDNSNSDSNSNSEEVTCIATAQGTLVVTAGSDEGKSFPLADPRMSLGRGTKNNVVLTDIAVSRQHLLILFDGQQYHLKDLGSGNGTFVNDQKYRDGAVARLYNGDLLKAGKTTILLQLPNQPTRPKEAELRSSTPLAKDALPSDSDDEHTTLGSVDDLQPSPSSRLVKTPKKLTTTLESPQSKPSPRAQKSASQALPAARLPAQRTPSPSSTEESVSAPFDLANPGLSKKQRDPRSTSQNERGWGTDDDRLPTPTPLAPNPSVAPVFSAPEPNPSAHPVPPAPELALPTFAISARTTFSPRNPLVLVAALFAGIVVIGGVFALLSSGDDPSKEENARQNEESADLFLADKRPSQKADLPPSPQNRQADEEDENNKEDEDNLVIDFDEGKTPSTTTTDGEKKAAASEEPTDAPASPALVAATAKKKTSRELTPRFRPKSPPPPTKKNLARRAPVRRAPVRKAPVRKKAPRRFSPTKRVRKSPSKRRYSPPSRRAAIEDDDLFNDHSRAKKRAASLYKMRKFSEATSMLQSAAKKARGSKAAKLRRLAFTYTAVKKGLAQGKGKATTAATALQKALYADRRAGGAHQKLIKAKLRLYATKAAKLHLARRNYLGAKKMADLSSQIGGASGVRSVRSNLEKMASQYYRVALSAAQSGNTSKARKLFKKTLLLVQKTSPWYRKARSKLAKL